MEIRVEKVTVGDLLPGDWFALEEASYEILEREILIGGSFCRVGFPITTAKDQERPGSTRAPIIHIWSGWMRGGHVGKDDPARQTPAWRLIYTPGTHIYRGEKILLCRECGKPIFFVTTSGGRKTPVDYPTGWIHWATCTNPDKFRKAKR